VTRLAITGLVVTRLTIARLSVTRLAMTGPSMTGTWARMVGCRRWALVRRGRLRRRLVSVRSRDWLSSGSMAVPDTRSHLVGRGRESSHLGCSMGDSDFARRLGSVGRVDRSSAGCLGAGNGGCIWGRVLGRRG
jgi:hypothetical protein